MENNPISNTMVTLKNKDGEVFDVPVAVAMQSKVMSNLIGDDWNRKPIPIYNVSAKTLKMVIDYCTQHAGAADGSLRMSEEDLTIWDIKFSDVDVETLYDLMNAADYLEIEGLLKLTARKVVGLVKGKTVEEVREVFKIKN